MDGPFTVLLKSRQRMADLGFFSFEWYPFDDLCEEKPPQQLVRHPALIAETLQRLEQDGVPKDIPWIITEYGYRLLPGKPRSSYPLRCSMRRSCCSGSCLALRRPIFMA